MNLSHLTRVAPDLHFQPGAPSSDGNRTPALERIAERQAATIPEISSWVLPALPGLDQLRPLNPAALFVDIPPMLELNTARDVGEPATNRFSSQFSDGGSLVTGASNSPSRAVNPVGETVYHTTLGLSSYAMQDPPASTPTIPEGSMIGFVPVSPGMTAAAASIPIGADASASLSTSPNTPVSLLGGQPEGCASTLWSGSGLADSSSSTQISSRDTAVETRGPAAEALLPLISRSQTKPQAAELQGDIFIDGSKLGRWMTDRLVKAAESPRAAMTGFNSRMTPTWPGSPMSA